MTARSTDPKSVAISAKRRDTTPKKPNGRSNGSVSEARVHKNTSSHAVAEQVSPNKPLTDKQKLFVKFWAQGESIHTASARAGYNDGASIAYRMVRMPNILKLYEAEKTKYEAAADMSRKKVMDMLVEAYDMAKLMAEPASMVSAAREIGKMCGYYAPVERKVTVSGNLIVDKMNRLSDAELLKILDGASETVEALEYQAADEEDERAEEDQP